MPKRNIFIDAAEQAVQVTTEQAAQKVAKVAGGVTAGLSGVFIAWEAYQWYNMENSKGDLASALHDVAEQFQAKLDDVQKRANLIANA